MKTGEALILQTEYRGYPKGTPLVFLFDARDSGYDVVQCVVDNEEYRQWLKKRNATSMFDYVKQRSEDVIFNEVSIFMEVDAQIPVIQPLRVDVITPGSLKDRMDALKSQLEQLGSLNAAYTKNIGNIEK